MSRPEHIRDHVNWTARSLVEYLEKLPPGTMVFVTCSDSTDGLHAIHEGAEYDAEKQMVIFDTYFSDFDRQGRGPDDVDRLIEEANGECAKGYSG